MIRCRSISWLAAGLVALAGFANAAAPAAGADEAAVRVLNVGWGKAYDAGDAKGVAALYADDALLLPPGAPGVRGGAAILDFFAKDIAGSKAAGVIFNVNPNTEVGVSGDTAWESGTYAATAKGAVIETGKFLSVFRKKSGKWQLIRDTWNADAPPAPAAAPAVKK